MKQHERGFFLVFLILSVLLSGCGTVAPIVITATAPPETPTSISTFTLTPDPCAPGNIETAVNAVHSHMREFDDASLLAANMSKDKVGDAIPNLQRIRREAEDQPIPACLANLKTYQVAHMNSVINTLIAFMGGADQKTVDQGISIARQQHDQYTLELARVLNLTIITATVPVTTATIGAIVPVTTATISVASGTPTP